MVLVYKVRMADGAAARTDGVSIWVNEDLNDIEHRCAIEHELVHIEEGHTSCQPEHIEMAVRYETARRLLPESGLGGCRGNTLKEVAATLGVTRRVLMDRAATLTRDQSLVAGCVACQLCPNQKVRIEAALRELVGNVATRVRLTLAGASLAAFQIVEWVGVGGVGGGFVV